MSNILQDLEDFSSNLPNPDITPKNTSTVPTYVPKKDSASERFLVKISELGYDLTELEDVLKTWGNQLVLSCAGSGKTTATILKLIYGTRTGRLTKKVELNGNTVRVMRSIWVSTFLRSGAQELKFELSKWNRKLGYVDNSSAINFSTTHAEYKAVLNAVGIPTNFINEKDNTKILGNILKRRDIKRKGRYLRQDDIRDFASALTYTRNRLDNARYFLPIYEEFEVSTADIQGILDDWFNARQAGNLMDFEDLQDILYNKLYVEEDRNVIDFVANRYEYLFVDEFQDTSQKQYEIMKAYMLGATQVVVVGDDDQTIYSWRGSDHSIITKKFLEDFNPTISKLSTNYRCPSNIVDAIVPSISLNTDRLDKSIRAFREGGELRVGYFPTYPSMVRKLTDLVFEDVSKKRKVAIICRENADGLLPALLFDRDGRFTYSISSEAMSLSSYMAREAINVVRLLNEKANTNVESALKQLTKYKYDVTRMVQAFKNSGESIWDVPLEDLQYSSPGLYVHLAAWRDHYLKLKRGETTEMDMVRYLLSYYHNVVYDQENTYAMRMRAILSALSVFAQEGNYSNVGQFLYDLEETTLRVNARVKAKGTEISIVTAHEFKGKDADSVYIWNDTDEVFPHKLSASPYEDTLPFLEEERRIHYIAATRAREVSTIMALQDYPSPFLQEMDLSKATILDTTPKVEKASLIGKERNDEARNRRMLEEKAKEAENVL